jgi:hypothetical protein
LPASSGNRPFIGSPELKDETKMSDDEIYLLTPDEASEWLKRHGVPRAPSTLAKLRCIGGGPVFQSIGRIPRYTVPRLREYVHSQLTPERTSSSKDGTLGRYARGRPTPDAPDAA